jgi:hypothetical protein
MMSLFMLPLPKVICNQSTHNATAKYAYWLHTKANSLNSARS